MGWTFCWYSADILCLDWNKSRSHPRQLQFLASLCHYDKDLEAKEQSHKRFPMFFVTTNRCIFAFLPTSLLFSCLASRRNFSHLRSTISLAVWKLGAWSVCPTVGSLEFLLRSLGAHGTSTLCDVNLFIFSTSEKSFYGLYLGYRLGRCAF